jgi:hypothetical protein
MITAMTTGQRIVGTGMIEKIGMTGTKAGDAADARSGVDVACDRTI